MRALNRFLLVAVASHAVPAAADPLAGIHLDGWYGKLGVETGVAFGAERGTSAVVGGIATLVHINDRREWVGLQGDLLADGNGQLDPQTDGLLLLRYMFGVRGPSLIAGAIGLGATRIDAPTIQAYMQSILP